MQYSSLFTAALAAAALAACGGGNQSAPAQQTPPPSAPAASAVPASTPASVPAAASVPVSAPAASQPVSQGDFRRDAARLQKIEDELKALPQFAGKDLHIFKETHFYFGEHSGGDRVVIMLQDPNKPENVDAYEYHLSEGKWREPNPVKLQGSGDLKPHLVPLSDAPFAKIADFYKLWDARAKEVEYKGEGPSLISFVQPTPKTRFYQANMETERANYMLRMNPDGSEKSFEK